ncbi:hypothetical protein SAMN04487866_101631 [Thermoactinomyces sp. DSM 45891]|uniref:hypothetical protein n=1 Tax=Thermoactinomyces sp. DSM 45891 TaxID=1761907 RepID=UPI00091A97D4|nr:hypothetical protein [Thermoactinomyces sp. DSM 45891]SFX12749.1 hypothetical protein SAMN04487866_101631 [Thermoactinomyces sp. DSM 45891]
MKQKRKFVGLGILLLLPILMLFAVSFLDVGYGFAQTDKPATPTSPVAPASTTTPATPISPATQTTQGPSISTPTPSTNVPNACTQPTGEFAECPSTYFKFDYIGKKVSASDTSSLFQEGFQQGFTFFLNLVWYGYTIFIYAVIYILTFSYRLELMTNMAGSMKDVLGKSDSFLWGGILPWLVGLVVLVALWKFLRRRNQEGVSLLVRNLLILTCASYFFTQIPAVVSQISNITGKASDYTLAGFLSLTPEKDKSASNPTKEQVEKTKKDAIQKVSSALWAEFYYKPYLVLQFGSVEAGQKNIGQLFSYGGDVDSKRTEWFTGYNEDTNQQTGTKYVDYEKGIAQSEEFKMVTSAGVMKRFGYSFFILLMGISFAVLLFLFSWKLLHWFFLAVGRVLLLLIPVVFSTIPGRSLRDITRWLWQILYALFMRVLFAALLGIAITLFVVIQGIPITDDGEFSYLVTFLMRNVLVLASFLAVWKIMKEIQVQLQGLVGVEISQPNWITLWKNVRAYWNRGTREEKINLPLMTSEGTSVIALSSAQKRFSIGARMKQWKKKRAIRKQDSLSEAPPPRHIDE